ncbi:MAG: hypothetical protein Ct9H300mP32_1680 [Verrucomicrobiota bacterium]|nr:MAG: hypothetical protein Ct9H300mP32_1680 [Verrucomicrobiota bacterium]
MHDEVAHTQVGKIDLQRRARRRCVGRFEPARSLGAVTSKNLRVGDDAQTRPAREKTRDSCPAFAPAWPRPCAWPSRIDPQFIEPLQFALGAADCPDGVAVTSQRCSWLKTRGAGHRQPADPRADSPRAGTSRVPGTAARRAGFANPRHRARLQLGQARFPVVVKQVTAGHLLEVIGDAFGDVVRLDQQAKGITDKVVAEPPAA